MKTGNIPEGIQRLWNQFQETSIYRTFQREFDVVLNQYPEEYQGFKQMIEKVKETLARDFEKQRQNIMHFSKPQHTVNWIVHRMKPVSTYNC